MRVLHICNDYCGSKVHSNLYSQLDKIGVEQVVYAYYRGENKEGINKFEASNTRFIYSGILKPHHRLLYHHKNNVVYRDLLNHIQPSEISMCHATTLFSDGAIAYKLYKDYEIPYIVTVRKTDASEFLSFAPHTWPLGIKILKESKKIVFISKAAFNTFCNHFIIKSILSQIQDKIIIQPNGVDEYWLSNLDHSNINNNHSVLYVGKFDYNKNVIRLIKSVLSIKKDFPDLKLHLVGGGGSREKKVLKLVKNHSDSLVYHGKIYNKDSLKSIYKSCSIFAMPSIFETFGLVYIEAMSQNLAILYTKNQGISGLFDNRIGESVDPLSIKSICHSLSCLLRNRSYYNYAEKIDYNVFRWRTIANRYMDLYSNMMIDEKI